MKRNYNLSNRLIAFVLFVGLFIQSCGGGLQNQVIPQEEKKPSKKIELSDHPLINTDKEIVTSGGYLASFYEDEGKLKADLKADEKQPKPNYKCIPVLVEEGADLVKLTKLDPKTQQSRIKLNRSQIGRLRHITIRKGGLLGGMMEGDDYPEKSKEKEKEEGDKKAQEDKFVHQHYQSGVTIKDLQKNIHAHIRRVGGYWRPLSTMARVSEEFGEICQLISSGSKSKEEISLEFADLFVITTCLANQYSCDLTSEYRKLSIPNVLDNLALGEWIEEAKIDKISGAKAQRPGLDQCLAELKKGDTLLVWRLDRLGRSMNHLVLLIEVLRKIRNRF